MQQISADYIFPVFGKPIKNGIITLDNEGKILALSENTPIKKEITYHSGIIVPGFINTHTHMELSGLRNKVPPQTGLPNFVLKLQQERKKKINDLMPAIYQADSLMRENGIVAAGDISNSIDSYDMKQNSKIEYYTFIEIIGLDNKMSHRNFQNALQKEKLLYEMQLSGSIAPHAPYSVNMSLLKKIKEHYDNKNYVYTIHNQESSHENTLFIKKGGKLLESLIKLGVSFKQWQHTGKNSLVSLLPLFPAHNNIILVHNLYTSAEDIQRATDYSKKMYWALCPISNLFIENKLPPIHMLRNHTGNITIGTDSLASNNTLSLLEEIKTISKNFQDIKLEELIKWATINGARALHFENELGTIEPGKKPGLNLITNIDYTTMRLTPESQVKVLF
jgi:cytosine/adenosine deaminase-related metal-dependent hydrolase